MPVLASKLSREQIARIPDLYYHRRQSATEIARLFGTHVRAVVASLRSEGLPLRSTSERAKLVAHRRQS